MSNILEIFNRVGKQTILDYARKGACEYIRINLATNKPDKRGQSMDKVLKGMKQYHLIMQVDYKRKVFNLKNT